MGSNPCLMHYRTQYPQHKTTEPHRRSYFQKYAFNVVSMNHEKQLQHGIDSTADF